MAKYCLTDCAKQKLSNAKKTLIEIISGLTVAAVLFGGFTLVGYIVGEIVIWVDGLFHLGIFETVPSTFNDIVGAGFGVLFILVIVGTAIYLVSLIIWKIISGFKAVVTNSLTKHYESGFTEKCKIFEECKDG